MQRQNLLKWITKKPLFLKLRYEKGVIFIPIIILIIMELIFIGSIQRSYILLSVDFLLQICFLFFFGLILIILAIYITKITVEFDYIAVKLPEKESEKLLKEPFHQRFLFEIITIAPLTDIISRYFPLKSALNESFLLFGDSPFSYTYDSPIVIGFLIARCILIISLISYPTSTLIRYIFRFIRMNKRWQKLRGLSELNRIEKELEKEDSKLTYININSYIFIWKELKNRHKRITFLGYICLFPACFFILMIISRVFFEMVENSIGDGTLMGFFVTLSVFGVVLLFLPFDTEFWKKMIKLKRKGLDKLQNLITNDNNLIEEEIDLGGILTTIHELYELPDSIVSPEKIFFSVITFIVTIYGFIQIFIT